MLIFFRYILAIGLVFLQACQQRAVITETKQPPQLKDAALFNTQLGVSYLRQGDNLRAKPKLTKALDLNPNSADANAAMGYYLEKTGDSKKAGFFYKKALSLAPNSGAQLNNYGAYLCRLGRYRQAEPYFLKAVKDIHYLNTAAAYENAGICLAALPDYRKASKYLNRALQQDPERKKALFELVEVELKQNRASKALNYLQSYPRLFNNDRGLLTLAINAAEKTKNTKAVRLYQHQLSKLNNFKGSTGEKNDDNENG